MIDQVLPDWRALLDFAEWHWRGHAPHFDNPQRFWQPTAVGPTAEGDVNGDGLLDLEDFFALGDARQLPAFSAADSSAQTARPPRDSDGDGQIHLGDATRFGTLFSAQGKPFSPIACPRMGGSYTRSPIRIERAVSVDADGRLLSGYALEIAYDPEAYRLIDVEHDSGAGQTNTLSWQHHVPGRLVVCVNGREAPAGAGFSATHTVKRSPFRLGRAHLRALREGAQPTDRPHSALHQVMHLEEALDTAVLERIRPAHLPMVYSA